MGETVRERPSHYDVLGLKPGASADEIARAFAREISIFRPHTLGGIAEVTVAYEVLRNPERRRAYDEAIGVARVAVPAPRMTTHGVGGGSFVRAAGPATRPALTLAPAVTPDPPAVAVTPIGEALRELARPAPLHDPVPAAVAPRPSRAEAPPPPPVDLTLSDEAEADPGAPMPWKRAGIAAGAVALTIAVGGAWAGWQSSSAAPPDALKDGALLAPPTTFTVGDSQASVPLPPPTLAGEPRVAAKPRARAAARAAKAPEKPTARLAEIERNLAEPDAAPAEAPAPTAEAAAVPASLPLPKPVIARTIGRIGYPCGSVASASAVEGGVFTVTCTSGHSYRASPVRGRYHFRRVSG